MYYRQFFFSSRRRHTRCALVTGVQTCALPISNTFSAVADELLAKAEREGKAEATLVKKRWLLDMAKAHLGARPIAEISAAEILVPLRQVEARGNYETACKLRATIGQVFRYAIATARAENDPTFGLRGALTATVVRSEAHTSELQSIKRNSYAGSIRNKNNRT